MITTAERSMANAFKTAFSDPIHLNEPKNLEMTWRYRRRLGSGLFGLFGVVIFILPTFLSVPDRVVGFKPAASATDGGLLKR